MQAELMREWLAEDGDADGEAEPHGSMNSSDSELSSSEDSGSEGDAGAERWFPEHDAGPSSHGR
jgi:hypothetical protein